MRNKKIKQILTKNFLVEEYIIKKKSLNMISREQKISKGTILDYLIKFEIPRRKKGCPKGFKQTDIHKEKHSQTLKIKGHHADLMWGKEENNGNYKHGKYCNNKCQDCGIKISPHATFCQHHACIGKRSCRYGKVNPSFLGDRIYYNGICFRSSYEYKYAKYLDKLEIKWQYEPKTFDLGNTTYTPDFYLLKENKYIEIKGWFTISARKKIEIFKELYPDINFLLLQKEQLQQLQIL